MVVCGHHVSAPRCVSHSSSSSQSPPLRLLLAPAESTDHHTCASFPPICLSLAAAQFCIASFPSPRKVCATPHQSSKPVKSLLHLFWIGSAHVFFGLFFVAKVSLQRQSICLTCSGFRNLCLPCSSQVVSTFVEIEVGSWLPFGNLVLVVVDLRGKGTMRA